MVRQKQITETGPKPLIGVRNPDLYPQASNPIDAALSESQLNDIQNLKAKALYRNYDVSQGHIGYEALRDPSLITPINTGLDYGSSTYDKGLLINATPEDIQNQRASSQPWYLKVTNGLAKGVILAGTTFLDGTVGLVTGIGEAFNRNGWSGLWDNDFSRLMQTVNEISEQELPNYYSTQETEGPWYENVFTTNFLGDKFIKNLGFTVGAFYSGNVFSAALKATKIPQLMGTLAKAAKFAKASEVPKIVLSGVGAAMSAVNEGRIEALNNSKQWFEDNKRVLDVEHLQRVQAIKDQYGDTAEASILIQDEIGAYNEALGKLTEDRLKMGNMDLLFNIPILTASNLFQFAKLYANGFKSSRRAVNILIRDGKFEAATTKLGAIAAITRGALTEGTEEITQYMASNIAGHYYTTDVNNFYKAKTDRKAEQETLDWVKSFAHGINETVNDGSAWEEFAIGFLTGALGIPRFRGIRSESGSLQSPITTEGGAINGWREYKDKIKREQDIANYMNNRMQSPEFKNYYQGLIRHNKYQKDMDKAAEDGDAFEFKNAEHAQLVSDILTFDNAGRLEELKGMIGEAFDTSDENLDAIVRNTTTIDENGKLVGPFADWAVKEKDGSISSNFGNEESKQKLISELTKNKDDIFETIKQYQETREKLDINTGQQLSDEQLEELTWMQTQLGNWAKRAGEMSSQVKDTIDNVIGRLESQMRAAESIRTHEGMAHTDLSENYRRADRVIQLITKAIDNLNFVRSLDNETMAATLAKNPDMLEGLKAQVNKLDNDVLSVNDKESVLKKLDDLSRLGNASKIYQDKFAEYLFNPKKQEEDHAKADKQNIDKDAEITRAKQVEALNKTANFQEVEALINNGEATLDDLNGSSSDAARSYKKASLFKKKATELITSSDSEHKSELLDMLNRRFNENATYDDLSDESLITELPLEATTWDEKEQETLEHEFNKIVIAAREKVDSGNSQKQDVEAKKTGTKRPDNVGKDDVAQPPVDKPFSIEETINKIDKLNIVPEAKTEAKTLANQIANNIEKLSKSKDPKLIRQTQRSVNALSSMVGNDAIADIIDRVKKLSKPDTFNPPSPEEVLREAEAEMSKYKPTAVAGVLKAVVPQFDLDAKRDGVLIPFVGDNRNSTYAYVYRKLSEPQGLSGETFNTNYQFDETMSAYGIKGRLDRVVNGTAIYVDNNNQPVILLSAKGDHTFIGIFREPGSNRWSIKMENPTKDKDFRKMISSVMSQLPIGSEIYERTSISLDGIRVFAQQLKHGFIIGNDTYVTYLNGADLANTFNMSESDRADMAKVSSEGRSLEEVQRILKPYLERFGVKDIIKVVSFHDGYIQLKLPVLVKASQEISTEVSTDIPKEHRGKTAFDYVNEGNVKEGDELEVRYEPATDEHSELLALYHKGTLVNYMNTDEAIEGVKEIKDKAKKGEQPTVRVSKIMSGQYGYDRSKPQSVGDLLGTDDATIGVMKNRSMEANTDTFVEPVFDEANSDGKVYILLPNSKGTLSPKMVHIRHLNKTEFDLDTQDNPIANDLKKVFNNLAGIANLEKGFDEALDNVYMDLIELLYIPDSFHINIVSKDNDISLQIAFADRDGKRQNRNILLKRFAKKSLLNIGAGTTQTSEPYTAPVEEVYNQVLNAFYEANLAFNVNAKKLTGKKGQEYANRLRDSNVLTTYLTGKRMQGTWFLLNEKPNTTHTDSAFERARASQQAKGGTRVQYGGKEYFVRNGIIFDQTGSIVDLGEDAQQVKDLAYINSAYGTNYFGVNQHNGKVLIVDKNGKRGYNRATNKYLSPKEVEELEATLDGRKSKASQSATATKSLQESQKLVLRDDNGNPDTSSGSYMIKEEDGQYHEYQRVHSVIGSNYIGPSRGDAATSRGSLVDEIARQFLIDPANVTKPEGISDEAFGALKRGLGKFRDDANRRGLKLVADRTVVFHKYPDGRRIAGELDVFAYNPSTGEISIFDFKTSKYSTKDSSFSRVVNPRYFTRSNKDQYTLQLSAYAKLFEDSFGVPVSNLIIVPFQLKYSKEKDGVITRIFPENYVPLTYQSGVFETDKAPASQPQSSLRTIKGQYVTMGKGKPEYHQADMQVLFTTSNNQTFYLAKVDDSYKLVLPNGRSMTIDPSLVSDEVGRTRNNIMDFIQADNVAAAIQDAMSYTPLDNSPYGNSIELKETPKETPKPDDRMKRGLDALDRLNSLKPTTPTQQAPNQEAINKREKDEKASVAIDLSTALGRSQLARKKWGEMTDAEKAIISPMFEGMEEKDIQEYWDGTDAIQRESFIPACK